MEIKNRTPAAFGKALGIAFSFLFVLFSLFAVVGYMTYGSNVESDILNNFPTIHAQHKTSLNIPSNIAKIGMVTILTTTRSHCRLWIDVVYAPCSSFSVTCPA